MKKIISLLFLLIACTSRSFGQCSGCSTAIPLVNNDFSRWTGLNDYLVNSCPNPMSGEPSGTSAFYISNYNLPNWLRVNGTPNIVNVGYNVLDLNTMANISGGGHWCPSVGYQGVAANYPFLARGQYQINLNLDYWNNYCEDLDNATVSVVATSGLAEEPIPAPDIEDPTTWPGYSPIPIGVWNPTPGGESYSPSTQSFCGLMGHNCNQLYIFVHQDHPEYFSSSATYAGEPKGFGCNISSVDIKLCNNCPNDLFIINSPVSIDYDYTIPAMFYAGGLFENAEIEIQGAPFSNNPNSNTLLWAKYITIDKMSTSGNSFTALVNNGTFFEMLPNQNCGNLCELPPISGAEVMCISGEVLFTDGVPGGVWSSSNSGVANVGPDGSVTGHAVGTATITYTVGGCSVSFNVTVIESCSGLHKPKNSSMDVNSFANDNSADNHLRDISVSPNPAENNITITYPCNKSGQLGIAIKDVAGRIRYTESVGCTEGATVRHFVDMSTLEQGVYFVEFTLSDQHVVKKIVKL